MLSFDEIKSQVKLMENINRAVFTKLCMAAAGIAISSVIVL